MVNKLSETETPSLQIVDEHLKTHWYDWCYNVALRTCVATNKFVSFDPSWYLFDNFVYIDITDGTDVVFRMGGRSYCLRVLN